VEGLVPFKVYSFGYKNKLRKFPGIIIDVRKYVPWNPHSVYPQLTGKDKKVQDWFEEKCDFGAALQAIIDSIGQYSGAVYLGCTGGHHRSVYVAELLSRHYNIPVEHLDIDKP
jgi:RNase adaptor protein for sRNA GlmZ degradation